MAISILLATSQATAQQATPIIVVDQDRLFQDSLLGQNIADRVEQRTAELAAENRAIEAELTAEERDLTERRGQLEPADFRKLADAFDEKVNRLREEQDQKARELVALREEQRQRFTQMVGPILFEFMRQTGASVMLDRRSVVATADRVEVTDELIAEIDATVREDEVGSGSSDEQDEAPDTGAADGETGGTPDPSAESGGPTNQSFEGIGEPAASEQTAPQAGTPPSQDD